MLVFGSKIEKCQHLFSIQILDVFRRWMFFYFEKITFLEIFDMYLVNFDINSKYLVKFSQYFVKIYEY